MAEEILWTGGSSQMKNCGVFAVAAIIDLAVVVAAIHFKDQLARLPAPVRDSLVLLPLAAASAWAFWKWLKIRARIFRLTTERLLVTTGLLSRTTDSTELYRVKDLRMTQPFFLRLLGLENVELITSDQSSPDIVIEAIPRSLHLGDKCRNQVEACRQAKGTREVEVE